METALVSKMNSTMKWGLNRRLGIEL